MEQDLRLMLENSCARYGERTAIAVGGTQLSYKELGAAAHGMAGTVLEVCHGRPSPALVGIFGNYGVEPYVGMVGSLFAGCGYVPLNPAFPCQRLAYMVQDSGLDIIFVSHGAESEFRELLPLLKQSIRIIVDDPGKWCSEFPAVRFYSVRPDEELRDANADTGVSEDGCIYILYTSGSTGRPKGVVVSYANVTHYVSSMVARYGFRDTDRFSQTYDLTFDLSALSTYCCLAAGAALYPFSKRDKLSPVRFVKQHEITVWSSVPSLVVQMDRLRMLKPKAMPSLRISIFCGEPLTVQSANKWQDTSPGSWVENVYGPTEATISCSYFRWGSVSRNGKYRHDIVPIGLPMPGVQFALRDDEGMFVSAGERGELCITGAQVCIGYTDPDKTRSAFFERAPPEGGPVCRWYRTGDIAFYNEELEAYEFLGRVDNQVKLHGYRIEIGEIEAVLKKAYACDAVVVVPHPVDSGVAQGLVAFLEITGSGPSEKELTSACEAELPGYMCPRELRFVEAMPLNVNGKYDRGALLRMCDDNGK